MIDAERARSRAGEGVDNDLSVDELGYVLAAIPLDGLGLPKLSAISDRERRARFVEAAKQTKGRSQMADEQGVDLYDEALRSLRQPIHGCEEAREEAEPGGALFLDPFQLSSVVCWQCYLNEVQTFPPSDEELFGEGRPFVCTRCGAGPFPSSEGANLPPYGPATIALTGGPEIVYREKVTVSILGIECRDCALKPHERQIED